jgi:hypothetical protein
MFKSPLVLGPKLVATGTLKYQRCDSMHVFVTQEEEGAITGAAYGIQAPPDLNADDPEHPTWRTWSVDLLPVPDQPALHVGPANASNIAIVEDGADPNVQKAWAQVIKIEGGGSQGSEAAPD